MYVGGIIFREMSFSSPRVIVPIHKLQLLLFEVRRLLGTRGIGKGGEDGPMSVKQPPTSRAPWVLFRRLELSLRSAFLQTVFLQDRCQSYFTS